jgi:hypothetical protein
MRRFTKRSTAIAVSTVVTIGAAGAAWAAWSLSGSGSTRAKAGSVVALDVASAGLPPGGLTPGNPTAILLRVENRNRFPVRITRIELSELRSTKAGCDADANVDVVGTAPLPSDEGATVPAGREDSPAMATITWSGPLRMKADPADACQGAPFTFDARVSAISAAS